MGDFEELAVYTLTSAALWWGVLQLWHKWKHRHEPKTSNNGTSKGNLHIDGR